MTQQNYDVLVIGGGMVGATLAAALAQKNIKVAVFDRTFPPSFVASDPPDIRVSALTKASENILKNVGAWSSMTAMRMCPYRKMAVWEKLSSPFDAISGQWNKTVFDSANTEFSELGFIVENRVIQLGLLDNMKKQGVTLFCPAHIISMDMSGANSSVTLSDGRIITGTLLVGADGANSQVRQKAGLGLDQQDYQQQCLVATVEIENGCQDITWQAFTATGPEAFLPLPDVNGKSFASIVWYNQPQTVRQLQNLSDRQFLSTLQSTFPDTLPPLKKLYQRASFPIARRHAHHYCKKNVVLIGDAAHTINPLAGQGVNLGLQDAAWLAEILETGVQQGRSLGCLSILKEYEMLRRPENTKMMYIMDAFYHTFSNNYLPLKILRNIGLGVTGKITPAVHKVMGYAMGTSGKQPKLAQRSV
ncbi:2-octaprenyl-3-methyl-6-methoxy-1,4-benzoquinol hydroxylase [invertebrate metagenome]|uniref:2-octaprenyl-3-methyl-6-methoxy-1,4-benzoquinol hydroxylase n=1 Tax=invertebrate metagenome TaxID=1711999 RepID=A0A2H9T4D6_9ZZZZ